MHWASHVPGYRRGRSVPLRRAARVAAPAVTVLVLLAAAAAADTVTTKSGETFTGTIVEQTDEAVVLKTISGKMTIPMVSVKAIARDAEPGGAAGGADDPDKPPPKIVPAEVTPADVDATLKKARTALVAGKWVEAGGLLEGLMRIDLKHFPAEKRLAATGALITCYLQIRDAHGAATAIARRAALAEADNDRLRLTAGAEMLRDLGTTKVGEKRLGRFEEVMEAAMPWKADQCLGLATKIAQEASGLNSRTRLYDAAEKALAQLAKANVYAPGFADAHRQAVLGKIVDNVLQGARDAIVYCKKVRPELTKRRFTSIASKPAALQWNKVARVYLGRRQAAVDALNLLETFARRYQAMDLYTAHEADAADLLAELDEYQYYPKGTRIHRYYTSTERVRIQLRTFGG